MRRALIGLYILSAAILILALIPSPPALGQGSALNTLTKTALQKGSFAIAGIWSGAGSLHLDGGIGATAGNKVNLEGAAGDTYLERDADTGCWQEWKDGTLGWQLCTSKVIPPDCASETPTLEFGAFCKDQTNHRVLMNTGSGNVIITGSIP